MQAVPAVPLVATTRGYPDVGYTIENIHAGSIAVVDLDGRLLAWAGDPQYQTFTRSALKPFQALPFLLSDGPAKFGLLEEEVALLCASHSGEEKHLAGVRSILGKIGLDAGQLECGCGAPCWRHQARKPLCLPEQLWCSGVHAWFCGSGRLLVS